MASGQRADGRVNRRSPRYRTADESASANTKRRRTSAEDAPLVYEAGRDTPVTKEEALRVLRRKRRAELKEQYANADPEALQAAGLPPTLAKALKDPDLMPTELSRWDVKKAAVQVRLPRPLVELLNAHAELEGTFLTTVVEMAIWKVLQEPPLDPAVRRAEYLAYLRETVGPERAQSMLNKLFGGEA